MCVNRTCQVFYKGNRLSSFLRPDFVCFDDVVAEVKALTEITGREESQVLGYLKGTGFLTGLLLNFGVPSLWYKRFTRSSKCLPPALQEG
jgi:GxxExxY protein